jgi:hypothetical protein
MTQTTLRSIPNVGPAIEKDLRLLGIEEPSDLTGRDGFAMYEELCVRTGERHDPCVIDVFLAAVHYAETGEARTWWSFTPERKAKMQAQSTAHD